MNHKISAYKLMGDFMNLVDRFMYKLFFMSFLLLLVVGLDRIDVIDMYELRSSISDNINFLKIITSINGKTNLVLIDLDDEISANTDIVKTEKITNGVKVILDDYEAVESRTLGIVVKIEGKSVYILDNDNYLYCYKDLDNIDVNLYQIIKKNQIIGKANFNNNINYYKLYITKDGKVINMIP